MVRGLGLGNLVLVVREDEVEPSAVDVEGLAEVLLAHRRALDVPPGTASPPRRVPRRLARLLGLPEREVEGLPLLLAGGDALARPQLVEVAPGKTGVPGPARDLEVDVPLGHVCHATVEQLLDEREDLRDDLGHARGHVGLDQAQRGGILLESPDVPLGQRGRVLCRLPCRVDDLVVDVRVVPDVRDAVPAVSEITHHDVEDGERPGVADVHPRVDGGTTHVQTHFTGAERLERLLATGQRVVDGQRGGVRGSGHGSGAGNLGT